MALVTICKYRRAKTPYFLEQAGLNMYSLEELAWFLYHNICLAEPQMFDDRLCRWLEEEVRDEFSESGDLHCGSSGSVYQSGTGRAGGAAEEPRYYAGTGALKAPGGRTSEQPQRMGGSGRVSKNPADASEYPAWRRVLCGSMEQSGDLLCAAVPV